LSQAWTYCPEDRLPCLLCFPCEINRGWLWSKSWLWSHAEDDITRSNRQRHAMLPGAADDACEYMKQRMGYMSQVCR
jgi:hypothetical protein